MFWLELLVILLVLSAALLSLFFKNFNRDPERMIPSGSVVVSPADGRVLDIVELDEGQLVDMPKGLLGRIRSMTDDLGEGPHYLIPIFMNPFDVHVQRAPITGRVLDIRRKPGGFIKAYSLDALENATVEMLLDTVLGKVKVLQTAGLLVRHIHNNLSSGTEVRMGDRFGNIDFGSQVTLIIPKSEAIEVAVKKGDYVYGGETVMAVYKLEDSDGLSS